MNLGVGGRTALGSMTPSRLCFLLLLAAFGLSAPAWSADPAALKETLGKVQSDAESRAVEDLIDKLKGVSRQPAASTTPAPAAASAPATAPPPAVPSPQPAPPSTATTEPPSQVASPAIPEAPTTAPDESVRRAQSKQAPSIDLEVFFEYKSAEITPRAAEALTPLGRALSDARLAGDSFVIAGHSDAKGSAEYNLALSQQRAESVRQFLIANFGIDGAKLVAIGMGLKHLKNTKDPLAAENRRVQIVNLSKDAEPSVQQR
jgi:outer membrane protein OmpA-like peptidoglycan-associated protein